MQNLSLRNLLNDSKFTSSFTYYIALLSMIIIPVYHWYLPPLMLLWGIFWIIDIRLRTNDIHNIPLQHKVLFILYILFFIWQIIGIFYSDNTREGWRNIELRLSLVLYPLVLLSPGEMIQKKISTLLKVFTLSTFLYIIICFIYAFYRSVYINNGVFSFNPHPPVDSWLNYFYASEFAIFQHPSYLSMYVLISIFIASESFMDRSIKIKEKIFWLIISGILLISLYLLSSRAGLLAAMVTVSLYISFKYKTFKTKINYLLIFLFSIFILLLFYFSNPRLRDYLKGDINTEWNSKMLKESRILIWKSAYNIICHNVIFGVGTGDIQDKLNEEYIRSGNKVLTVVKNLNAHNQFLEVLLENGLIGLLLFLSLLGTMLFISISNKNLLYLMFLIIIFVSCMFETILNRLGGVSFFSLFSSLFLTIPKNKN
jgi:O-antigen ligase